MQWPILSYHLALLPAFDITHHFIFISFSLLGAGTPLCFAFLSFPMVGVFAFPLLFPPRAHIHIFRVPVGLFSFLILIYPLLISSSLMVLNTVYVCFQPSSLHWATHIWSSCRLSIFSWSSNAYRKLKRSNTELLSCLQTSGDPTSVHRFSTSLVFLVKMLGVSLTPPLLVSHIYLPILK